MNPLSRNPGTTDPDSELFQENVPQKLHNWFRLAKEIVHQS